MAGLPLAVLPLDGTTLRAVVQASRPLRSACQCGEAKAWGAGWGQSWSRNPLLEGLPASRPCGCSLCGGLPAGAEGVKCSL